MPNFHRLAAFGRTEPFKRLYLGGTFDCLHRGHLALFAFGKTIADELVVSLNTDDFAAFYKRRPLMPLADRLAVVSALRDVDFAVVNTGNEDSRPAIDQSGADAIGHGSDWVGDKLQMQMGLTPDWLQARGIRMVVMPYTEWTSTTKILEGLTR